jgi:methyl-accepting chemotaxis protein
MFLLDKFIPAEERRSLPAELGKRLPFVVYMDIIFIFYFFGASVLRFREDPAVYGKFMVAVLVTNILFFVSLFLVRRRRYRAASYLGGVAPIVNVVWIGFLLPYGSIDGIYRFAVYLLACVVSSSLVAIERRQVLAYSILSLLLYPVFIFAVAIPGAGGSSPALISIAVTVFLLVASISLIVILMARLNDELMELARSENRNNMARATALSSILGDSRTALDKGKRLKAVADESMSRSGEVRRALEDLGGEARALSGNTADASAANLGLVERTRVLKAAVAEENALLEETTASLGRVLSTVKEIGALTAREKENIAKVSATAETQSRDLRSLKDNVARVSAASKRVLDASGGISDISERIGLLAMNASIEAAHAGSSGKGFSVISQEVRKLSDETKVQTARIEDSLGESGAAARETAVAVEDFARKTEVLVDEVKATFDALGTIVDGLAAVSSEAAELDGRAENLQRLAKRSEGEVEGSSAGIGVGTAKLESISGFASRLASRVEEILGDFSSIELTIAEAVRTSQESAEKLEALDGRIAGIEGRAEPGAPEGN